MLGSPKPQILQSVEHRAVIYCYFFLRRLEAPSIVLLRFFGETERIPIAPLRPRDVVCALWKMKCVIITAEMDGEFPAGRRQETAQFHQQVLRHGPRDDVKGESRNPVLTSPPFPYSSSLFYPI